VVVVGAAVVGGTVVGGAVVGGGAVVVVVVGTIVAVAGGAEARDPPPPQATVAALNATNSTSGLPAVRATHPAAWPAALRAEVAAMRASIVQGGSAGGDPRRTSGRPAAQGPTSSDPAIW
jgi:FlaG/FlaF family flagellin (archaellin)